MKNVLAKIFLLFSFVFITTASTAGGIEDLNCTINSLFGSTCSDVDKINRFQDRQQQAWMGGAMTATEMVNSVISFHRNLIPINSYDKELYMYNLQVAQAVDAGKIPKERGLYLMTKMENELNERIRANQPPPSRRLNCVSQSFGGVITTQCN